MPRLRLTEVMAQNDGFPVTDARGNQIVEDWVEVHNPNSFAVDLTGYTLSDRPDKPKKFPFPRMMISPGGYVLVFLVDEAKCANKCDQKKIECAQRAGSSAPDLEICEQDFTECIANCSPAGLVAQFNISSAGEAVFLFGNNGTEMMDRIGVKNQAPDVSNGIDPVTGELGVLYLPTPGAPNQRINLKGPRFVGEIKSTPAPNPTTVVTVTATVERDLSAPGDLAVSVEFADLPQCNSSLEGHAVTVIEALEVADDESMAMDTSRVDPSGKEVDVEVVRRTYQASLPAASECGVNRVYRFVASDPSAQARSGDCVSYCLEPVTVEVNEYQPRNTKWTFFHKSSKTGEVVPATPSWIEVVNYGDKPVDVANLGLASLKDIDERVPPRFDRWLFGKHGHVTEPLAPGGFLLVLADNDGGETRREYHLNPDLTGPAFFSTHFGLDPSRNPNDPVKPKAYDGFYLVTSTGNKLNRVLLDFSANGYDIEKDKSVGRFPGTEDHEPNALKPGTITPCPTPLQKNIQECEVPPSFDRIVTRETAGATRCPGPNEPVTVRARVNFDSDAPLGEIQVELLYRFTEAEGGELHVPIGPDLTFSPAQDQSKAAPGSILYDIAARIPGQPDKTLVIFSLVAVDSRRGQDELKERPPADPEASFSSFRYLVGFEPPPDHPLISEVLPGNDNLFVPPDQNAEIPKHPDFAEIYNPGTAAVDLGDYFLTTTPSPDQPIERARHWRFPEGRSTVPAKGFLTVYFDSFPPESPFVGVDAFNVSDCGETLYLIAPDQKELGANCVIDSFTWSLQAGATCKRDQAVGRVCNDGGPIVELSLPSPGASNARPGLLHDTFHQAVIPPGDRNECVPATSTVQLSAVMFLDPTLRTAFPESRGISSASFLVDRGLGSGEEEFRVTQFSSFPLCTESRPTDCATPPPGYENVSFRALIQPPFSPVVHYRIRVVDACANVLEAGPFSFGTTGGQHPQVAINEINRSFAVVEGSPPRPWVELVNRSSTEIDLSGMFLTDDVAGPRKAKVPDGVRAPAGGIALLLTKGAAPAPFSEVSLDWEKAKGALFLIDSSERGSCILDKFDFDFTALPAGASLGRDPDGSGSIRRLDPPSPGRLNSIVSQTFVRGDATNDLKVNVVDMIRLLAILFSGETRRPPCEDALDANDDGKVNASDAVFIGRALTSHDTVIPLPFPEPGADPTPDGLSPCK
jgi:hypothetical protein